MERIIVLGGKGGVGKSSISSATAVLLSDLLPDKNFLLISFDIAHNLSDLFEVEIGNKLTALTKNLWGIEPDPNIYAEEYTKQLIEKLKTLTKQMPIVGLLPQIENFIDTTFSTNSIPLALKNAMFFQKILEAEENKTRSIQFDIILADFPPTGDMVKLFEIPEDQVKVVLKYSLNFYNSIKGAIKNVSRVVRSIIKPFDNSKKREELGNEIFNMLVDLEERGERVTNLIHKIGSLRLVTIAEKPSFEEIKRARDMTARYINLDAVHINMLTPEEYSEKCDFCSKIRSTQLKYLKEIEHEFQNLKIWESHKLKEETIGLDGLRKLAKEIYGEKFNINEILYPKK